jgi:enoyl-CoA hydratase/carnithine racemase
MLRYEVRAPVARLILDRPEKLNAMTRAFWGELREALAAATADASVRVVLLSGDGPCFSVGGDIDGFAELRDTADRRAYVDEALGALRAVEECPKPTIAAVHGHALGGGCELTMVCDLVVADETARFGTPEASVALIPGLAVVRGRANVNLHWLKYLVFTGVAIDAAEAKLAGLVNAVVPAGGHLAEAERWAELIAERSPLALSTAKAFLGRDAQEGYAHAVDAVAMLMGSGDVAEGLAAFGERRPPVFEGR